MGTARRNNCGAHLLNHWMNADLDFGPSAVNLYGLCRS